MWHPAGQAVTTFFNNLSLLFPEGERFFMDSVRHYQSQARDPRLAAEIRDFLTQEALHGLQHERFNRGLVEHGYPAPELEGRVRELLALARRVLPPRLQLSVTCALEHYTALLATIVLDDPTLLEGADEAMAELWRWHALEEDEHKAVAYALFEEVGGTYVERAGAMVVASVIFWAVVFAQQRALMRHDGIENDMAEWRALAKFLYLTPGRLTSRMGAFLDYLRPGFHPFDHGEPRTWSSNATAAAGAPSPNLARTA